MPAHRSHGRLYIEPPRHDELPTGVAAAKPHAEALARPPYAVGSADAAEAGRRGGSVAKGTTRLSHRIDAAGLREPYRGRARALRRVTCSEYASGVGGGRCGVVASLLVKFGCEAAGLAEQALDDGDIDLHRKLAESSRMHLMYAREACAKDAATRPQQDRWWEQPLPALAGNDDASDEPEEPQR